MDIATLGCSVNVKLSADRQMIEDARIAYGVAGPVPMRAPSAEKAVAGCKVSAESVERFAKKFTKRYPSKGRLARQQGISGSISPMCYGKTCSAYGSD
ncbi:MAG: hypothetical protein ACLR71_12340 [[Clostridium] scindens]